MSMPAFPTSDELSVPGRAVTGGVTAALRQRSGRPPEWPWPHTPAGSYLPDDRKPQSSVPQRHQPCQVRHGLAADRLFTGEQLDR